MRGKRAVALILVGLGAFALVAGLCVRLILVPTAVKLPLDQTAKPTADATELSYFDLKTFEQHTGETGTVVQKLEGDPGADQADSDTAVWAYGSVLKDSGGVLRNAYEYTACLDRKTAQAQQCDAAEVDGEGFDITGLTVTFPFGTEKKTYDVFNPTARAPFPAKYVREEQLDGLTVYRFEQVVPETVVRSDDVPGEMAGAPATATVHADFVYSNTRTMWVEPTSGVVVKAVETPNTVVRGPDGTDGVTWLAGTFTATDKTVATNADRARDTRSKILLVSLWLPIGLGVLGLLLLGAGFLLLRAADRGAAQVRTAERPVEAAPVG
jgi:hypothetical protein